MSLTPGWLRRMLGASGDADPPTRLTAARAIEIAAARALAEGVDEPLTLARPIMRDGRVLWFVSQAAFGRIAMVEVDDADGIAGPVRWEGSR